MKRFNWIVAAALLLAAMTPASAQKKKGQPAAAEKRIAAYAVGFYNLENLFDTVHAVGKKDQDFLPDGSYKWNTLKYESKLKNMSMVLAEMGTDRIKAGLAVCGVSEVENRFVLEELLKQESLRNRGWRVMHFPSPDRRGVGCGLFYNPRFFTLEDSLYVPCIFPNDSTGPTPVGFTQDADNVIHPTPLYGDTMRITRGFLVGIGTLANEKMAIIVNHWPSRFSPSETREETGRQVYELKEALLRRYPGIKIVIEGDLNDDPNNKSVTEGLKAVSETSDIKNADAHSLYNPWYNMLYKKGQGTLMYQGQWNLFDQIIISGNLINGNDYSTLTYKSHEIFMRDYLIQQEGKYKGSPLRTTAGGTWLNGFSDHLPTIVYLVKEM